MQVCTEKASQWQQTFEEPVKHIVVRVVGKICGSLGAIFKEKLAFKSWAHAVFDANQCVTSNHKWTGAPYYM